MFNFVLACLLSMTFALLVGFLAEKKGVEKVPFWVILGAVLGPLAIPLLFFAKTDRPPK